MTRHSPKPYNTSPKLRKGKQKYKKTTLFLHNFRSEATIFIFFIISGAPSMVSQGVRAMPFGVVAVAIIKSKPPESARASRPLTVAIIHYPLCRASRPAVTI